MEAPTSLQSLESGEGLRMWLIKLLEQAANKDIEEEHIVFQAGYTINTSTLIN